MHVITEKGPTARDCKCDVTCELRRGRKCRRRVRTTEDTDKICGKDSKGLKKITAQT
jgi:hypothetical protein